MLKDDWLTQVNKSIDEYLQAPPKSNEDCITLASLFVLRDNLQTKDEANTVEQIATPLNKTLSLLQSDLSCYVEDSNTKDLQNVLYDIEDLLKMLRQGAQTQHERKLIEGFVSKLKV
jgi:hypothetical protein